MESKNIKVLFESKTTYLYRESRSSKECNNNNFLLAEEGAHAFFSRSRAQSPKRARRPKKNKCEKVEASIQFCLSCSAFPFRLSRSGRLLMAVPFELSPSGCPVLAVLPLQSSTCCIYILYICIDARARHFKRESKSVNNKECKSRSAKRECKARNLRTKKEGEIARVKRFHLKPPNVSGKTK
jgi:hypothetical protein